MINNLISAEELKNLIEQKADIELIDVRTPEKHALFNIGGKLIPIDELHKQTNELNKNKMVVTYCTSGGKSMQALDYLLSQGFQNVKSLDGGMSLWRSKYEKNEKKELAEKA